MSWSVRQYEAENASLCLYHPALNYDTFTVLAPPLVEILSGRVIEADQGLDYHAWLLACDVTCGAENKDEAEIERKPYLLMLEFEHYSQSCWLSMARREQRKAFPQLIEAWRQSGVEWLDSPLSLSI